jgi:hypothetical protein
MLNPLQKLSMIAMAAGVAISEAMPEPKQPKVTTQHDFDRIEAAKQKRERKNAKRLGLIKGDV